MVLKIPKYGFPQAALEVFLRYPAKLGFDFAGVNSVSQIMSGPVGHDMPKEGDQVWAHLVRGGRSPTQKKDSGFALLELVTAQSRRVSSGGWLKRSWRPSTYLIGAAASSSGSALSSVAIETM